jgi:hypothetical protein
MPSCEDGSKFDLDAISNLLCHIQNVFLSFKKVMLFVTKRFMFLCEQHRQLRLHCEMPPKQFHVNPFLALLAYGLRQPRWKGEINCKGNWWRKIGYGFVPM